MPDDTARACPGILHISQVYEIGRQFCLDSYQQFWFCTVLAADIQPQAWQGTWLEILRRNGYSDGLIGKCGVDGDIDYFVSERALVDRIRFEFKGKEE